MTQTPEAVQYLWRLDLNHGFLGYAVCCLCLTEKPWRKVLKLQLLSWLLWRILWRSDIWHLMCACNSEKNTVGRGRASVSTSKCSHFYICLWPTFATSCSGPCRKTASLHLAYGLCRDLALAISTTHPQDKYSFSFSCKNLDSKINVFL